MRTVLADATPKEPSAGFPIVGLGASAGGLEAFVPFFRSMPPDNGMAFVLVPHLDPSHASFLTEILQRSTAMPVIEAQDQMAVAPNSVDVIPPNRNMAIFHGALQLSVPEVPRGQRMPIDAFLRSLAEDQGDNAIGIVLSGTGTDGTLGLRAILGAGGITLVQEPATAKYDGMPASAIQAGYATHVLPVEGMPPVLLAAARHLPIRTAPGSAPAAPAAAGGLNRILISELGNRQWDIPALRDLLENVLPHDRSFDGYEVEYDFPAIGRRRMLLNARRIPVAAGGRELILLAIEATEAG